MDIVDILSVGLTAEDFATLLDAIEALPGKGLAGEMAIGMWRMMRAFEISPESGKKVEAEVSKKMKDFENLMDEKKENLTILKSKIILLKRLIMSQEAVKMANEILNKKA